MGNPFQFDRVWALGKHVDDVVNEIIEHRALVFFASGAVPAWVDCRIALQNITTSTTIKANTSTHNVTTAALKNVSKPPAMGSGVRMPAW
jgi:hypothetical protein